MKKIITLCLFAFAMLLGTQTTSAQSSLKEIDNKAIEKTESLSKYIGLNSDQKDEVYMAFKQYGKSKMMLERESKLDDASMKKIKTNLEAKLKSILTEEQFASYTTLQEQEN